MATWPSGKAEACKAFTPGSNPGVAFYFYKLSASVRWGIWGKYTNIKPILAILED